jgi:4-amino-4-deoxy-L-arabinose transferase-like glycosyltransferase
MEGAFPITLPLAVSFRGLGVGIWQARLVGVAFTIAALLLIYYLAARLYDKTIALATLAVLLFMSAHPEIHPIVIGRQVLGEMPALFYLLAGYACLLAAFRNPLGFMPLVIVVWAIAVNTKRQVLPFWLVSLVIPLALTVIKRNLRIAGLLGIALAGSLIASSLLESFVLPLLEGGMRRGREAAGIYDVTALVSEPSVRLLTLARVVIFGLPTAAGLLFAGLKFIGTYEMSSKGNLEVVKLSLLVLSGSWFGWYLLSSVGWIRYLFPPIFVGSVFLAALLSEFTERFNFSRIRRRPGSFRSGQLRFVLAP